MTESPREPVPPKPVFAGCLGMIAAIGTMVAIALFMIVYLESGADTGRMVLRDYRSYAEGIIEYVGERNFYVVRLGDGSFLALDDLDAANRAAEGRRCRVQPLSPADPALPDLLATYRSRFSDHASGANVVFREDCNRAVYDAAGLRLDGEGRNLDRYGVGVNEDMQLVVDVSRRICTEATPADDFTEVACSP